MEVKVVTAGFVLFIWFLSIACGQSQNGEPPPWMLPDMDTLLEIWTNGTEENNITVPAGTVPGESSWIVHVNTDRGIGILVTVLELDIDPTKEDYLLVAPGMFIENGSMQVELLTGKLATSMQFYMPDCEAFFVKYVTNSDGNPDRTMLINFESYGVPPTTVPPQEDGPTAPSQQDTEYRFEFAGLTPEEFNDADFKISFKNAVRSIARKYCAENKITFDDSIQDMVYIYQIASCPADWPTSDKCAAVTHAVYVSGTETKRIKETRYIKNYELTSAHLKEMWEKYGTDEDITNLNIKPYEIPETSDATLYWALGIGGVVLVFLVVLVVFCRVQAAAKQRASGQRSDSKELFEGVELRRRSQLKPSQYQTVPDLWGADSDVTIIKPNNSSVMSGWDQPMSPKKLKPVLKITPADSPSNSEQFSPVTPAVSFAGALHFNYRDEDED